jgi:tetratricopeptide (TPR) repeat protein
MPGDRQAAAVWNTLGVAHYRAGHWQAAIEALERSDALAPGEHVAHNGLFLAMAHAQRGEHALARRCYDRAIGASETSGARFRDELKRFAAEARALLELTERKPVMPNGADAFDR